MASASGSHPHCLFARQLAALATLHACSLLQGSPGSGPPTPRRQCPVSQHPGGGRMGLGGPPRCHCGPDRWAWSWKGALKPSSGVGGCLAGSWGWHSQGLCSLGKAPPAPQSSGCPSAVSVEEMEGAAPQRPQRAPGRGRFGARASVSARSGGETGPHQGVSGRCLHCLRLPLLLGVEVLGRRMKVWAERRGGVSRPLGRQRWAHVVGVWPSVAAPGPACRQPGCGEEPGVEKLPSGSGWPRASRDRHPAPPTTVGYTLLSLGPRVPGPAPPPGS